MNLPSDLIRKAKVYAAEHDTTVNGIVRELLEDKFNREAREAARRFLAIADRGPLFKAEDLAKVKRDDLYER